MGLDVSFSRAQAVAAGMQFVTEPRDEEAALECADDPEARAFWSEVVTYVKVPGTDLLVDDGGSADVIVVRANRWGRVHGPLTAWLKANDIAWDEF